MTNYLFYYYYYYFMKSIRLYKRVAIYLFNAGS